MSSRLFSLAPSRHRRSRPLLAGGLSAVLALALTASPASATAAVAKIYLNPPTATQAVCTSITFVAEADDAYENGVAGETITFTVTGANTAGGSGTTDANGDASFTYEGRHPGTDTVTATDEAAGLSKTASVTWTGSCGGQVTVDKLAGGSLFDGAQPGTASADDTGAVELGVAFTSDVARSIDGIRFYKGPGNTGTHVGSLWSADGVLLARATFTDESATGWQSVRFATPVPITPHTTYVASYHAPAGGYAFDGGYFAADATSRDGSLHAPAGANGVFTYSAAPIFPTSTFNSTNYWVDVMYATDISATEAAAFTIATSSTGSSATDGVTLSDVLPAGLAWAQDDPANCSISGGVLTCHYGTLAPGSTRVVHVAAPTTTATCGTIVNRATVTDAVAGTSTSTADLLVRCPQTQTIAGHIYQCSNGSQTTTEVPGGTLGATGPQLVPTQANPLGPVNVAAGSYTMEATAPPAYEFVPCGGGATISDPTTASQQVSVPPGGQGVGIFYVTPIAPGVCPAGPIGGINLGGLQNLLFFFADGSIDANWQSASKGYAGDVVINGLTAKERTSGSFAFAGTLSTNDTTLGAWSKIVTNNAGQASSALGKTALVDTLSTSLDTAMAQIDGLAATPGYENRSATSLDGLNTRNGVAQTIVVNITSGLKVSTPIAITGDAGDVFVLRWDTDANPANGYQGQVKFQSGGAVVPRGDLGPGNFINVAGDINASGGGSTPAAPYPQGPRLNDGLGSLISGGADFSGGGFFTGYWLTTGSPDKGETASLSNAIFVGGWYSTTTKFSMTSGTSGVHVCPATGAIR